MTMGKREFTRQVYRVLTSIQKPTKIVVTNRSRPEYEVFIRPLKVQRTDQTQ